MLKSSVVSIWEANLCQVLERTDRRCICQGDPELGSWVGLESYACSSAVCDFDLERFDFRCNMVKKNAPGA